MIADAPPHGNHLHRADITDDFPDGSPEGLNFAELMKEFKEKDIDFNFIKLDKDTDEMIEVMLQNHD